MQEKLREQAAEAYNEYEAWSILKRWTRAHSFCTARLLIGADERVEEHRRRQKVYERNRGLGEKASSLFHFQHRCCTAVDAASLSKGRLMPTKWYLSRKWRACEKHFCALSIVFGPSGVHPIFGKAGSVVKIWLLQNAIAFWGIKVQIVPYHFVSKQIPCAHPFCRLFSMPPILCLEKAGSDPMGLISTGILFLSCSRLGHTALDRAYRSYRAQLTGLWWLKLLFWPSGELSHSNGKIHHAINGKIHYFDCAIFNSKLLVHQRV